MNANSMESLLIYQISLLTWKIHNDIKHTIVNNVGKPLDIKVIAKYMKYLHWRKEKLVKYIIQFPSSKWKISAWNINNVVKPLDVTGVFSSMKKLILKINPMHVKNVEKPLVTWMWKSIQLHEKKFMLKKTWM